MGGVSLIEYAPSTYYEYAHGVIAMYVPHSAYKLKMLCDEGTNKLNSRNVIDKFIALLNQVPQYQLAEKHRDKQAATLKLKSYTWNFDIVPCFFTAPEYNGRTYYLIPDGKGNWQKTDPRIDRGRVTQVNQDNDKNILNLIRVIKYWNKRLTMPSMDSYLLENMVLDYYSLNKYVKASSYIPLEIPKLLQYIQIHIFHPVNDPKSIQGNMNNLDLEDKEYDARERHFLYELERKKNSSDTAKNISPWHDLPLRPHASSELDVF